MPAKKSAKKAAKKTVKKSAKKAPAKKTAAPPAGRVEVRNPNVPTYRSTVDGAKHAAMKKALLKVMPRKAPGLSQNEMFDAVRSVADPEHFPGGAKVEWWSKCVQLDMEARGELVREASKPLRWHRA